jgi:dihydroorotase
MTQDDKAPVRKERYELLLKGGRVIDPANARDGLFDVAISQGRIAAIAPSIPKSRATKTLDVRDRIVTPGLIDTHAHVFQHVAGPFGLNPDAVGLESGVSMVVDQGGPSCLTIDGFRKFIVEPAQTPVRCYISTYLVGGLYGHQHVELYGPHGIDVGSTVRSIEANRDIVRGIKSHAEPGNYSRWGIAVLEKSKEIGRATGLPVYIHLGTLWPVKRGVEVDPAQLIREIVPLLDPGDVLAHPFTRHPSGFSDPHGKVHPLVFEAVKRGVVIDVGRGSHFSIAAARAVLDAGVLPYTLGADLHGYNIKPGTGYDGTFGENATFGAGEESEGPAFSLHYAMTEMLALGIPLQHVIAMVTAHPAKLLREEDSVGALSEGRVADIAVLELQTGDFVLRDGLDATMKAERRFRPAFTLKAGKIFKPVSGYLPYWERMAA